MVAAGGRRFSVHVLMCLANSSCDTAVIGSAIRRGLGGARGLEGQVRLCSSMNEGGWKVR